MDVHSQGRYSTLEIRVRAVEAINRGLPVSDVADAYGVDRTTLFRWATRFDKEGLSGLNRKTGSGRPRLLEDFDTDSLLEMVLEPATAFGFETDLWTIGRLHRVVQET